MIKYAIFDLDDTLLDFKKGEREGLTKILRKYGVHDIDQGIKTYLKVNRVVWNKIEQGQPREELLHQRFTDTFNLLGMNIDGTLAEREYRTGLDQNFYKIGGAERLLTNLKNAGVHLMVGTNGIKQTQISRLKGSNLDQYFEDFFISEDIGYTKPDKRFFTPIQHKYLDMDGKNTVMIGDRIQADVLGAKRAALSSIWFNPNHSINSEDYQPTYIAQTYDQIEKIILN